MKRTIIATAWFIALSSTPSRAQNIERYYDTQWKETQPADARYYSRIQKTDSGWLLKNFFISEKSLQMTGLYSDEQQKIKNGEFIYYHSNGRPERKGKYIHDKKEGIWVSFHRNGMMADSAFHKNGQVLGGHKSWSPEGYLTDSSFFGTDGSGFKIAWFDNGSVSSAGLYGPGYRKKGKWKYYHKKGQPSSEEYYENGQQTGKKFFNEDGTPKADSTNPEKPADFPGGVQAWYKYLKHRLYFPPQYKLKNGDRATVVISFIIDESGKVSEAFVSDPFHPAFDVIALQLIQKSPDWVPATDQHNRHVKAYRTQPVTFLR
ncbi:energy transducer TonB [Niabella drilacis]|uniref:TonB family C-terminal domain-containing protein n=1 Tax=Niabella drilacis (strain DSM 25811 / CCM 8410 / CCUG 62505 / LMG 26954 / E90) TaxID=1285928 RepID=A0A1G6X1F8_NIADE|nr:energy transducer TonB [Niabella drilacis]SDD71879.1 TonB family C-terminal domain-containing protein [Niabella drilacis]